MEDIDTKLLEAITPRVRTSQVVEGEQWREEEKDQFFHRPFSKEEIDNRAKVAALHPPSYKSNRTRMEETMNDVEVRNNPAEYRYEVFADGELAGYTQYVFDGGRIAFLHTEVYDSYEGLGLGTRLARETLDDARARRLVVEPFCPFIASYIERHIEEYGDLVAPEMLSGDRP